MCMEVRGLCHVSSSVSFHLFFWPGNVSLIESGAHQLVRLVDLLAIAVCLSLPPHSVLELLGLMSYTNVLCGCS